MNETLEFLRDFVSIAVVVALFGFTPGVMLGAAHPNWFIESEEDD